MFFLCLQTKKEVCFSLFSNLHFSLSLSGFRRSATILKFLFKSFDPLFQNRSSNGFLIPPSFFFVFKGIRYCFLVSLPNPSIKLHFLPPADEQQVVIIIKKSSELGGFLVSSRFNTTNIDQSKGISFDLI